MLPIGSTIAFTVDTAGHTDNNIAEYLINYQVVLGRVQRDRSTTHNIRTGLSDYLK
jgi:hypothetical protein